MAAPALQMLTANRLLDGEVVYWHQGEWVPGFAEAQIFDAAKDADAALEAAQAFVRDNTVVSPYLFEVRHGQGGIVPAKEREIIRAAGPSVRADLGKQAGHEPHTADDRRFVKAAAEEPDVQI